MISVHSSFTDMRGTGMCNMLYQFNPVFFSGLTVQVYSRSLILYLSLHRVNECLPRYTDMSVCLWSKIYIWKQENKNKQTDKWTNKRNKQKNNRKQSYFTGSESHWMKHYSKVSVLSLFCKHLGEKKIHIYIYIKKGKSPFDSWRHRSKKLLCTLFSKEGELCASIAQARKLKTKFAGFYTHLNCLIVFFCLKIFLNLTSLLSPKKWSADLNLSLQNICFNNSKTDYSKDGSKTPSSLWKMDFCLLNSWSMPPSNRKDTRLLAIIIQIRLDFWLCLFHSILRENPGDSFQVYLVGWGNYCWNPRVTILQQTRWGFILYSFTRKLFVSEFFATSHWHIQRMKVHATYKFSGRQTPSFPSCVSYTFLRTFIHCHLPHLGPWSQFALLPAGLVICSST